MYTYMYIHVHETAPPHSRGLVGGRGGDDEAALREKERQQLLAEIDEKKRKILREVEVSNSCTVHTTQTILGMHSNLNELFFV